jgi:acetoin utilization protein AcuB
MAEHRLGSAVVAHDGKLLGVFTTTDALRALAALLTELEAVDSF